MFFVPAMLFAAIGDNGISVAPDGTQLKWEEGAWDFFIMHKSLIKQVTGEASTTAGNPQADTCIEENIGSTYTLTSKHIPPDANIDRAFLVWLSGQDPSNLNGPTDNSVTLTFTNASDSSITLTREITASLQGNLSTTTIGNFEYEALNMPDSTTGNTGVFTYRVEVSDFMKEIISMGEAKGMDPGEALYGDYNVKGMECSNHQNYLQTSGLVGGWFLPFVYTSSHIGAKKIYFYNGLAAYRDAAQTITVSGFELPDEAIIKLGLVVFEGDPGLYSMLFSHMEGLAISSQSDPTNFAPMFNDCNPNLGSYTEMYNSISSVFGWEDSNNYWCIGNPNNPADTSNPIEYAIDADILMVDASPNGPFYGRFVKGDTMLNLQIGANQDQVYTNLLIVSVDTKLPDFDIPNEREKDFCSCAKEADTVCADKPFYYTIKVQNHGQNVANAVQLQDALPSQIDYVPGTTEIATKFDAAGNGTDWTQVPDVNGGFPYATAQQVALKLEHCNTQDSASCGPDTTAWIRFQVKPKSGLSKNEVIRNDAVISSADSETVYHSNSNIPLRLKISQCSDITDCDLPPKAQCGGVRVEGNDNYCTEDKDCKDGKKCKNNECVLEEATNLTENANISFGIGTNSPGNGDDTEIIIPNNSEKLVIGQFYLLSDGDAAKSYEFKTARFKFNGDPDVTAKNFKLYKDSNSNGVVDPEDVEIASAENLKQQYIEFSITNRSVSAGIKTNFIVVADASTNSTGNQPGKFNMVIEGPESFLLADKGTVAVTGDRINFATFRFEPSEGFVFTKGTSNPGVPKFKEWNGEHEVLQLRTKSIGMADKIKSIKVRTEGASVKFGQGIKSVSLYIDRNGDGKADGNDTFVAKISSFESDSSIAFENLGDVLQYAENEEKFLVIKLEFKMSVGEKAKIKIPDGSNSVKMASGNTPVGLPVSSNEFRYECDESDPNACGTDDEEDGGCAILAVPEDSNNALYLVLAAFAALLTLAGVKSVSKK